MKCNKLLYTFFLLTIALGCSNTNGKESVANRSGKEAQKDTRKKRSTGISRADIAEVVIEEIAAAKEAENDRIIDRATNITTSKINNDALYAQTISKLQNARFLMYSQPYVENQNLEFCRDANPICWGVKCEYDKGDVVFIDDTFYKIFVWHRQLIDLPLATIDSRLKDMPLLYNPYTEDDSYIHQFGDYKFMFFPYSGKCLLIFKDKYYTDMPLKI